MNAIKRSIAYGISYLCSRKVFIASCIAVPLLVAFFFIDLMKSGLPLKVPVSVVDLDRSSLSRRVIRNLGATELINVEYSDENFNEALSRVRRGETFGFFMIPRGFQRDAVSGEGTTVSFYSDLAVYVPGTLAYKGFKTIAVTTAGGLVKTTLVSVGVNESTVGTLLQPVVINEQAIGNPWMNYSIYLSNSFIPGVVCLMVLLMTCYSICDEIKRGSSRKWLELSGGSMLVAVFGKLLPQTVVFSAIGVLIQSIIWGYSHFPLHCPTWHMIAAMILLVIGSQGFSLMICCIVPNLRISLSIASLTGILSFSIAAYSFPVESMYGAVGIFSYILPARYYFLIYADQALNGIPLYFSRWYYVALLLFPVAGVIGLRKLKNHCLNPVYVP